MTDTWVKASVAGFKVARDALFRNPTLETARAFLPTPLGGWIDPNGPLAAVHKARLQWLDATDAMLADSVAWLEAHGYETSWHDAPPLTPERRDAERAFLGKPKLAKDKA